MSRNNDVLKVLVSKGNQALLAAGSKPTALAVGQIGFFDSNTGLSVTSGTNVRNFYLGVGLDLDGDTVLDNVAKSSGSSIQSKNIRYASVRPYTPGRPQVVKLADYLAEGATEYGIKLELRNQEIYRTQGYNQFSETYITKTPDASTCSTLCPSSDANLVTKDLKFQINSDPTGLVIANALSRQIIPDTVPGFPVAVAAGVVLTDAQVDALIAFNKTQTLTSAYLYTDLQITTVTQKAKDFGSINLMYFYPRETVVIASPVIGFQSNGTLTIIQTPIFEEGSGYDIKQLEYKAFGWVDSPYRLSTLNGVADDITYNASKSEKYTQYALTYDEMSEGGWEQFYSNEATIVAIPNGDTVTAAAFATALDTFLAGKGFDAIADDFGGAAAFGASATNQETTSAQTVATDGLS
jgi:hypothetical protein